MSIRGRHPLAALAASLVLLVSACSGSTASAPAATTAGAGGTSGTVPMVTATPAGPANAGDPYANVDPCSLATTAEITAVMGETAHDPQQAMLGPGAAIDGAYGCTWSLGDSIDLFALWIYPSSASSLTDALAPFWGDGYKVEPLSGYGDEAVAVVWRGSASIRNVGQVAGVGVRLGAKAVLLSTLGRDNTDPKPAAALAVKILGRF